MSRRKTFITVIITLIALIAIASVVSYFVIAPEKPWKAFFVACCGGVLVVNLLLSLFLVMKNFKK
ncbi:hypothetical protein [Parabacteroides sp. PF5-6]|uniref:hypothetical protein n=1 Tax=Parabacteroides sp. PF5-6 TaxID=1742403 RepID=UPI002404E1D9|nr:hypothetical protein [Parabacteroides sp. PF5-6]